MMFNITFLKRLWLDDLVDNSIVIPDDLLLSGIFLTSIGEFRNYIHVYHHISAYWSYNVQTGILFFFFEEFSL